MQINAFPGKWGGGIFVRPIWDIQTDPSALKAPTSDLFKIFF